MAKWADYLISQVLYDQNHIITKVKQHRDIGNKISGGEIVDRDSIANNLGNSCADLNASGCINMIETITPNNSSLEILYNFRVSPYVLTKIISVSSLILSLCF